MKLTEIFNIERDEDLDKDSDEFLGQGVFSKVHSSKSDPHMVNKTQIPAKEREPEHQHNDPYWEYVKAIVKSKINETNPVFPRFYKIGTGGKLQMEKLFNAKNLEDDEAYQYLVNNFNANNSYSGDVKEDFLYEFKATHAVDEMANILDTALANNSQALAMISNEQILEACKFIRNIVDNNPKILVDIHAENIMFRRGKTGIQLVITDPFA